MFMEPTIEFGEWVEIESDGGTSWVPLEYFEIDECLSFDHEVTLKKVRGFGCRMSAPGYMDATDWVVFDEEKDAAEFLSDTYFEGPLEEMSQEERGQLHFLVLITGDDETVRQIDLLDKTRIEN